MDCGFAFFTAWANIPGRTQVLKYLITLGIYIFYFHMLHQEQKH